MRAKQKVFGAEAEAVELMWGDKPRPSRGPRPSLSLERIVQTAVGIADRHGLDAVSMERVAKELGFTAMALYRYVPGKAELFALMIDQGLGAAPSFTDVSPSWREQLEAWANRLFALFRRHPWSLAATGRMRIMGPNELSWLEAGLAALSSTGLRPADRHSACLAVLAQVRSMAQFAAKGPQEQKNISAAEWRAATRELVHAHAERFPQLHATLAAAEPRDDPFTFGLRCVLDGIEQLVASTGSARPPRRRTARHGG